jgi:hypothetical protein
VENEGKKDVVLVNVDKREKKEREKVYNNLQQRVERSCAEE